MSIHNKKIVVIAEKRKIKSDTNMYSIELDFSSENVTNDILNTLEQQGFQTVYYDSPKKFLDNISKHQKDIVFNSLWGGNHSRNKRSYLAAICEAYGICFVGADAYAHSLCQDKYLTKSFLKDYGFSIPKAVEITCFDDLDKLNSINYFPCIVKPNDEGCSVGISDNSIANTKQEAENLICKLLKHYSPVLVEQYIQGSEISICCAGVNGRLNILEAILLQINGKNEASEIWGCESKKLGQSEVSRKNITKEISASALAEAEKIYWALGKVDLMRIDGKMFQDNFYIIELSPDCSLHRNCFMANAFYSAGYSYGEMLELLVDNAYLMFNDLPYRT